MCPAQSLLVRPHLDGVGQVNEVTHLLSVHAATPFHPRVLVSGSQIRDGSKDRSGGCRKSSDLSGTGKVVEEARKFFTVYLFHKAAQSAL